MQFHGIPRNGSFQRNDALLVPSNSMELFVSVKLAYFVFHGIPWNCSCQRNWCILSSMEFHGTARVIKIYALQVPWNAMELIVSAKLAQSKFHGIPWNSMELLVSENLAHPKFHGIPWNCSCQRNWRTWSSMEFHGNWRTPSSVEFHGIPWNCSCQKCLYDLRNILIQTAPRRGLFVAFSRRFHCSYFPRLLRAVPKILCNISIELQAHFSCQALSVVWCAWLLLDILKQLHISHHKIWMALHLFKMHLFCISKAMCPCLFKYMYK